MIPIPVGRGKTAIGLHIIAENRRPALVISTKAIIEETWGQEIEEWGMPLSYAAFSGPSVKRKRALESKPDVLGVSFDNLSRYYQRRDPVDRRICIIDESTFLKAMPSQAKRVQDQIRHTTRFERCYALSATPAPEGALGLWSQFACVMPDRPLGNITQFRLRYFDEYRQPTHSTWTLKPNGLRGISRALAPYFFPVPPQPPGVFGIPDPIELSLPLEWSRPADAEVYRQFDLGDLEETQFERLMLSSPGVMQNKLRQLASGFLYRENGIIVDKLEGYLDKAQALARYVERIGEHPILVLVQFTEELKQIREVFPQAQFGLDVGTVQRWNKREIPMLVLHPKSAGHGLNLQHGGHHLHFYSMPWGSEPWSQSVGRLHRRGQARQVVVSYFMRRGTIEERIKRVVDRKIGKQDEIVGEMTSAAL